MIKIIGFILTVVFLTYEYGWAACVTGTFQLSDERPIACINGGTCANLGSNYCQLSATCNQSVTPTDRRYADCMPNTILSITPNGQRTEYCSSGTNTCLGYNGTTYTIKTGRLTCTTRCETACEADSVRYYASCVAQADHYWDSEDCECKERTEADSVFTVCTEDVRNGTPYYEIYVVNVHYKDGSAESSCGVSPNLINGEGYKQYCPLKRSGNGTCANAGVPNGPSEPKPCNGDCSQVGGDMLPNAECYAVVGYNCYLKDNRTGNTFKCECDGSCSKAMLDLARPLGEGANCRNPYLNPSSSDSGGGSSSPSSSDSGNSSDSGGGSSSPSSSTGAAGDYTQQLDQLIANTQGIMNNTGDISQWTQTTMNNTTDIKNNLSDIGIDVNHIRTNTENTANNTANIDIKLSTTNSLLNDIKNKNWNPTINVEAPNVEIGGDTIIINNTVSGDTNIINVQGDTAKSGAAILDFLRNAFNGLNFGSDYSENDTLGMGAKLKATLDSLEDINRKADSVPNMSGQLGAAKQAYGAAYQTLVDSMNHAMGDSVNAWSSYITNNGVLTGSGSNDCPSILTRTWSISFPIGSNGFSVTIPAIGGQLCRPITILGGATFWTLCRVILRMVVAIMCMMWVYRAVIGADSNED